MRRSNPKIDWKTGDVCLNEEDCVIAIKEFEDMINEEDTVVECVMLSSIEVQEDKDPLDLPKCIEEFRDVLSSEDLPNLPPNRPGVDMVIDLIPGEKPPFGPIYALTNDEELELQRYISLALEKGLIRPSRSAAASPVLFVKKPNGKLRFCVDYRGINRVIHANRAPLPIIKEILEKASTGRIFTKLDLKSAFNLIRIKPGHEWLTAFRTKYGLFEYLVVPFGGKNAPATFQGFINQIFCDLIDRGLLAYIDDLLIYAKDQADHDVILLEVFKRIRENKLVINSEKCEFGVTSVGFLGHIVSPGEVGWIQRNYTRLRTGRFLVMLKNCSHF